MSANWGISQLERVSSPARFVWIQQSSINIYSLCFFFLFDCFVSSLPHPLFPLLLLLLFTPPLVFFFIHLLRLSSSFNSLVHTSHSYFLFHSSFYTYSHTLSHIRTLCVPCNSLSHKTCLSHFFPSACLGFLFVPFELPSVRGTRFLKCSCWSSFLSIVFFISVFYHHCCHLPVFLLCLFSSEFKTPPSTAASYIQFLVSYDNCKALAWSTTLSSAISQRCLYSRLPVGILYGLQSCLRSSGKHGNERPFHHEARLRQWSAAFGEFCHV